MATLGTEASMDDVRRAAEVIERVEGEQSRRRAWTPGVRRALIVVCVFFIFQQITGINVPLYYGPHLLGPIFSGAHATLVQTTVAGVEVTAIMTVGQRRLHLPGVPLDRQVRRASWPSAATPG